MTDERFNVAIDELWWFGHLVELGSDCSGLACGL